jgi:hypothetical protein
MFGYPVGEAIGSPAERFLHVFSIGIFVLIYLLLLWRVVRFSQRMRTVGGLIYWMAVAWLLYCAVGSPWFWPWYLVTFFGLYALLEAGEIGETEGRGDDGEAVKEARAMSVIVGTIQAISLHGDDGEAVKEARAMASIAPTLATSWKGKLHEGRGDARHRPGQDVFRRPWMARLLSFSMLSLYCFITWGPAHSFVPGVPGFLWTYLGGAWAWLLPLAGLALITRIASAGRFLNHFLT